MEKYGKIIHDAIPDLIYELVQIITSYHCKPGDIIGIIKNSNKIISSCLGPDGYIYILHKNNITKFNPMLNINTKFLILNSQYYQIKCSGYLNSTNAYYVYVITTENITVFNNNGVYIMTINIKNKFKELLLENITVNMVNEINNLKLEISTNKNFIYVYQKNTLINDIIIIEFVNNKINIKNIDMIGYEFYYKYNNVIIKDLSCDQNGNLYILSDINHIVKLILKKDINGYGIMLYENKTQYYPSKFYNDFSYMISLDQTKIRIDSCGSSRIFDFKKKILNFCINTSLICICDNDDNNIKIISII